MSSGPLIQCGHSTSRTDHYLGWDKWDFPPAVSQPARWLHTEYTGTGSSWHRFLPWASLLRFLRRAPRPLWKRAEGEKKGAERGDHKAALSCSLFYLIMKSADQRCTRLIFQNPHLAALILTGVSRGWTWKSCSVLLQAELLHVKTVYKHSDISSCYFSALTLSHAVHRFLKLLSVTCALPNVTSRVLVVGLRLRMTEQHVFLVRGPLVCGAHHWREVALSPAAVSSDSSRTSAPASYTVLLMSSGLLFAYLGWPLRGGVLRQPSHYQRLAGLMH